MMFFVIRPMVSPSPTSLVVTTPVEIGLFLYVCDRKNFSAALRF